MNIKNIANWIIYYIKCFFNLCFSTFNYFNDIKHLIFQKKKKN